MKVRVDPEICQGHGVCHMTAPGLFLLRDEDGQAYVEHEDVPPGEEESAQLAADSCPERAITVY
ncbi:ferredoxin [Actinomadura sp. GTD37]|uniref:ferredoxin n=1 Tax=Actinomadura sp. GTD37 TaxID=1778030 RepID=UPI0035C0898E